MNWLTAKRWSPYLTGILIGVLCWIAFYVSNKPIGVTTAFAKSVAMIEKQAVPKHLEANQYLQSTDKEGKKTYAPKPDWEWMLVVGIFVGALFSSALSRDFRPEVVPGVWRATVGKSGIIRLFFAFLGGVIVMFGARLAGGCTTGHGLSGGLQLYVGSWAFLGALFVFGIVMAMLIYRAKKAVPQPPQPGKP